MKFAKVVTNQETIFAEEIIKKINLDRIETF